MLIKNLPVNNLTLVNLMLIFDDLYLLIEELHSLHGDENATSTLIHFKTIYMR